MRRRRQCPFIATGRECPQDEGAKMQPSAHTPPQLAVPIEQLIQKAVAAALHAHATSGSVPQPVLVSAPVPTWTPPAPDACLTRQALAPALTAAGYPISVATLTTKACRGGGPPMRRWGPRVLYVWSEALAWAQSRVSAPRRSTSEPNSDQAA